MVMLAVYRRMAAMENPSGSCGLGSSGSSEWQRRHRWYSSESVSIAFVRTGFLPNPLTAFALNILFKIPVRASILITGLSTLLLLGLQRYGKLKQQLKMRYTQKELLDRLKARSIKIGPWGGQGGNAWDMENVTHDTRLSKIVIQHGAAIDSILFRYEQNGIYHWFPNQGGPGGRPSEINLEPDEFLTSISGHCDTFQGSYAVTSLTFTSNVRKHGPYGHETGTAFTLPLGNGKIVGFHGRAGSLLDAIGVHVLPN